MRKWQILTSIFALLVVCDEAKAGDKEDVLAYMDGIYTSVNAGDWDSVPFRGHTRFTADGSLLRFSDPEATRAWIKSSGITINLQAFHKNVDVYGNTAVYTCYEAVRRTPPDGETWHATVRVSVVFAKIKGNWEHVHVHVSHLTPVNPE